jgi:hypothetical protein
MQDQLGCTPASTLTRHPRHRQWKCTSSMSRLWNRNCTSISNWECESLESPHLNSPYSNVVTAGQPMLNHFQLAWQMCSLLESDAPAAVPAMHCPIAEHLHQFARSNRNPLGGARRDTATYHPHSVLPAQCVHDLRSEHRSPAASLGTYTVLAVNANQAGELIAYSCTPTVTTDRSALYSERWCMVGGTRSSSFVGGLPPPSGMARVVGGLALLARHDTWSPTRYRLTTWSPSQSLSTSHRSACT